MYTILVILCPYFACFILCSQYSFKYERNMPDLLSGEQTIFDYTPHFEAQIELRRKMHEHFHKNIFHNLTTKGEYITIDNLILARHSVNNVVLPHKNTNTNTILVLSRICYN